MKNEKNNNLFSREKRKKFINNKTIKENNINSYIKFKRFHILLILCIISFIKNSSVFSEHNQQNIFFKLSEITLKINSTNNFQILSDTFFQRNKPYEIYINDSLPDMIRSLYYFNYIKNNILIFKIKWNISITVTDFMFQSCDKIIDIDLSHFNTSQVSSMNKMFYGCSELISLNLSNLETSQVNDMGYMFYNCYKINILDLSNFDT